MAAKTPVSVAVLTTVVDNLKQQVYSAVDVFCTEALRTSSELTGDGLETAMVTLNAVLDQLKDKGDQAMTNSSKANISSAVSSSASSGKEVHVAAVDDETQNILLSRMNRLERSVLEVVQKGEQIEERQKVLDETSATKTDLCDLQDQLRMCPLESSLKRLESEVQSRFAHVSQELGKNKDAIFSFETDVCLLKRNDSQVKEKMSDMEKKVSQFDNRMSDISESIGQEMNMVKLTITELDKKSLNLKDAMSSAEADVCVLMGNFSKVQEKMSENEKKVSQDGNRISDIEERLKKAKLKEKKQIKILSGKTDQLTLLIEKKIDNLEKLKVILNQLKDRTTERDALSSKVDQMEQNLSQLSQTVEKLHQTVSTPPIAFCAMQAYNKDFRIKKGETVNELSNPLCNAGNALDATKGIFTAPRDGLYGIAAQARKVIWRDSEFIQLKVIRRCVSSGKEYDIGWLPIAQEESSSNVTCIIQLKAGDHVFLHVIHTYEGVELSWTPTFAGWLIR